MGQFFCDIVVYFVWFFSDDVVFENDDLSIFLSLHNYSRVDYLLCHWSGWVQSSKRFRSSSNSTSFKVFIFSTILQPSYCHRQSHSALVLRPSFLHSSTLRLWKKSCKNSIFAFKWKRRHLVNLHKIVDKSFTRPFLLNNVHKYIFKVRVIIVVVVGNIFNIITGRWWMSDTERSSRCRFQSYFIFAKLLLIIVVGDSLSFCNRQNNEVRFWIEKKCFQNFVASEWIDDCLFFLVLGFGQTGHNRRAFCWSLAHSK